MTTAISPSVFRASVAQVEGPSVADVLRMDSIRDKAAGGPFDTFCKRLRDEWRYSDVKVQWQMIAIFKALDSDNLVVAVNAHQIFTFLEDSHLSLRDIITRTLPLSPEPDVLALHQIALKGTGFENEMVRKRAFYACVELVIRYHLGALEMMAERASLNLRNPDEKIRGEGLDYSGVLFLRRESDLLEADLSLAIDVASKIYFSNAWENAYTFFHVLIESGKPEHVLKIQQPILDACTVNRPLAFVLCESIIQIHHRQVKLLAISLQAANNACKSENQTIRDEGFKLFGPLLLYAPNFSISSLMTAILMESKRKDPCEGFHKKLCELVNGDFSKPGNQIGILMEARWKTYGPSLLQALNNLLSSGCFKESVVPMKTKLENRL